MHLNIKLGPIIENCLSHAGENLQLQLFDIYLDEVRLWKRMVDYLVIK